MEWAAEQIKASRWYVGDGGFVAQAFEADSLEAATATGELWSAKDNTGIVFRFNGARFADSELDGAMPLFALCDVVNTETGELGKVSVGGSRVVATLFRACQKEWFPFEASFAAVALDGVRNALNLVIAPERVKSTTK